MKSLKFSEFIKDIEGEIEEVPEGEIVAEADLYSGLLYSAVPEDHNINLGVFPEDQGFTGKNVLLWSSFRDIPNVFDKEHKIISVRIPDDDKRNMLKTIGGGIYAISRLLNTYKIKVVKEVMDYVK